MQRWGGAPALGRGDGIGAAGSSCGAEPALCVGDMRGNKGRVERAPGVGFAGLGRWVSAASEQVS